MHFSLGGLRIRTQLFLFTCLFVGVALLLGGGMFTLLQRAKFNGPIYQEIVRGKDLIADVLPPPAYVIESYLVAHQLLEESTPAEHQALLAKAAELEKEFGERLTFWK